MKKRRRVTTGNGVPYHYDADLRYAAALSYRVEDHAPRVLAAGTGGTAGRIIEAARKAGVAIVEDAPLAALLASPGGGFVPDECWEAVAKILAFVWKQEEARSHKQNGGFGRGGTGGILRNFLRKENGEN